MLLSPNDVQDIGLDIMGIRRGKKTEKRLVLEFHKHCGSSPMGLAEQWHDLCNCDKKVLSAKEKSEKGFERFLAAHCWLWCRPKNADMFASRFGMCVDYVRGKPLWTWIERIANLAAKKIVWNIDKVAEIHAVASDGVDFKLWERQHAKFPINSKAMSQKFKSCGAKHIVAMSVHGSKCVVIEGPFRGGKHDLDMFGESGLMQIPIEKNKICIADQGFQSKVARERECFALPDCMDEPELLNYKSRARL